jgi:S-adenosylmethionine hydrolase
LARKNRQIVAILTDFGQQSWYVPAIKGVILSLCPDVEIVDLSHQVPRQDVLAGAYILGFSSIYYPRDTVFLCIVDPSVGTDRNLIIMESEKRHYFVAPDNGLLTLVAKHEGIEKIVKITNRKYMLEKISRTFHGRDILAPAAAHLARGEPLEKFGPKVKKIVRLRIEEPHVENGNIRGKIIFVDEFGNIITNIDEATLKEATMKMGVEISVTFPSSKEMMPFKQTYCDVEEGKPLGLIGSSGFFEISVNCGVAAERYHVRSGSDVIIAAKVNSNSE